MPIEKPTPIAEKPKLPDPPIQIPTSWGGEPSQKEDEPQKEEVKIPET